MRGRAAPPHPGIYRVPPGDYSNRKDGVDPSQWAATTALPKTESTVQTGKKPESYSHEPMCSFW